MCTPGPQRLDAGVDRLLLERGPGQVLGLEQPPSPAPGADGATELQQPAQAPVEAGAAPQYPVLAGAGAAGLQPDQQQLAHGRVQVRLGQHLLDGRHLQVRQVDAERLKQVQPEDLVQGRARHAALGYLPRAVRQLVSGGVYRVDSRVHQRQIDLHAPVVDALVKLPQLALGGGEVDHGHALPDLPHGLDVAGGVGLEPLPLGGVRLAGGPVQLVVTAQRLAEQLDEPLAVLVLGLVGGQAQHLAEHAEATRQAVRHGLHHGVVDMAGVDVEAPDVPDHRAVEVAVVDHHLGIGQPLEDIVG